MSGSDWFRLLCSVAKSSVDAAFRVFIMQNNRSNKNNAAVVPSPASIDPQELELAFSLFNEASRQLTSAYSELQQQVSSLTTQLEIANGNLRRELEEKAALSRRLGLLLERLPGGVIELDAQGLVVQMNPAARRLIGCGLEGVCWDSFCTDAFVATQEADLWSYIHPEGGERRYSIVASDIPEESLRLLLIHDLTESWELQLALTRNQRLVAMGEMAAGLAHQLRTPLSAALLYAGHLGRAGLTDDDRSRFGGKMMDRLHHLEALIGNMLRFVRGQRQELVEVDLGVLIEEAVQIVLPGYEQNTVVLKVSPCPENVRICVDFKEFVGAIVNLLENARQASVPGSEVRVDVAVSGHQVCIEISDHGAGMSDAVLSRLFEPFFTTKKDGTGLGLAIVRNLMELYGGRVSVDSKEGHGSLFRLCLPMVRTASKV